MKYLIVLFVFFFIGCVGIDDLTDTLYDLIKAPVYSELHLYDPGLSFSSIEEIGVWINQNIKYSGKISYVQEPKGTLLKGSVDCKGRFHLKGLEINILYFLIVLISVIIGILIGR